MTARRSPRIEDYPAPNGKGGARKASPCFIKMGPMRAQLSAVSLISIMLCGVVRSMDSLQTAQFIDFLRRSRVTSLSVYCLQLGQRMRSKVKSEVEKFMANRFRGSWQASRISYSQ